MDPVKFHVLTFGCQMNVRDSQWLTRILSSRGFVESSLAEARVVIVNTCSVREKPEQKAASVIGRLRAEIPAENDVVFAIIGCVAKQRGEELYKLDPRVRLVAGGDNIAAVPDAVCRLLKDSASRITETDFLPGYDERPYDPGDSAGAAYVNIMRGCDNFCAYCIVPFTRGRQRSRSLEAVVSECERRIEEGAKEITLLGQNVNAWGKDLGANFDELLIKVADLPGLERLRFVAPHPADMSEAVTRAFGERENLCPRIHLPLQSGSDKILKKMNRRYDSRRFVELTEALRAQRPDIAISADIIVGFPGESEEDFRETLRVTRACGFVASYSFCYSDRPGTRATLMPDKIAPETSLERLTRLQELQEELGQNWLAARVGQTTATLLEGRSAKPGFNSWRGRDPYGAAINVEMPPGAGAPGDIVTVLITEAKKHSLNGVIAKKDE